MEDLTFDSNGQHIWAFKQIWTNQKIYVVSFVTKEVHIQVVENIETQVKEVIE